MRGLLIFLALSARQVQAQQPPTQPRRLQPSTGTARIQGRVVNAETGSAVRMATVSLVSPDTAGRTMSSDASGRFEFTELPAGRFTLRVVKAGFVTSTFGQSTANPGAIALQDGQRLERGDLRLPRGGVITGRVLDAFGDPVTEASVSAYRAEYIQPGVRRLSAGRPVQTNDLGDFRIYGVAPGKYYVGASLRPLPSPESGNALPRTVPATEGVATTFFPGTVVASDARMLAVEAGKETPSVDIVLQSVRLARVTGSVVDSRGRPSPNMIVWLNPARADGALIPTGGAFDMAEVDAAGRFSVPNIAPGDYRLDVQAKAKFEAIANSGTTGIGTTGAGSGLEFASVPLTVNGENVDALMVQTTTGLKMTGRLVVEGGAFPPDVTAKVKVSVSPLLQGTGLSAGLLSSGAQVQPDGTFEVGGLVGSRLVRVGSLPAGAALKSVRANGMDVTDDGLEIGQADVSDVEILVTTTPTKVTGTVTDSAGNPERDYVVVVFADDRRRWTAPLNRFVVSTRPNADGVFTLTALPPANYLAIALTSAEAGEWAEPDNLDRLRAKATAFTLADRENKSIVLVRR
jgi:Carboxypeptidase regulatory-like domain